MESPFCPVEQPLYDHWQAIDRQKKKALLMGAPGTKCGISHISLPTGMLPTGG